MKKRGGGGGGGLEGENKEEGGCVCVCVRACVDRFLCSSMSCSNLAMFLLDCSRILPRLSLVRLCSCTPHGLVWQCVCTSNTHAQPSQEHEDGAGASQRA